MPSKHFPGSGGYRTKAMADVDEDIKRTAMVIERETDHLKESMQLLTRGKT
jgi:hypothetical protein